MGVRSAIHPALWREGGFAGLTAAELLPAIQRLTMDTAVDAEITENWEDAEDVRGSLEGDEDAFRRLIERHQDWLAARMWRFTRDETIHGELVQDVFVEAWRSLGGFKEKAPFRHWLARIATRVGYRFWRRREKDRRNSRTEYSSLTPEPLVTGVAEDGGAREAAEILFGLLDALPPRDRLVLTLRYVEDLDVEETARRCGWSPAMVKVQSFRARGELRRLFESTMGESRDE